MTTAVIIDCVQDSTWSEFYQQLRQHLTTTAYDQILWASYGWGDLDSHFLALLKLQQSRMVLPEMTKQQPDTYRDFQDCVVMGRSWPDCVWNRPSWGVQSLLAQGKSVRMLPQFVTVRLPDGREQQATAELIRSRIPPRIRITDADHGGVDIVRAEDFWQG